MATLTTIPSELLLQIITHLRISPHFLSLSQTSHYFRCFLSIHAKTICNTHITTYYHEASSILHNKHSVDGWLIPTHPCIMKEDKRIYSDHQSQPQDDQACYRCCPNTRQARRTTHLCPHGPARHLYPTKLFSCLPMPWDLSPQNLRHQAFDTSVANSKNQKTSLAMPGPHYLLFLEKYSADIILMDFLRRSQKDDQPGHGKADDKFEWHVRTHCVGRFTRDVGREMRYLDEKLAVSAPLPVSSLKITVPVYDRSGCRSGSDGKGRRCWENIKAKMRSAPRWISGIGRQAECTYELIDEKPNPVQAKRPLLFGEIERSEEEPLPLSWKRGLIWFHPQIDAGTAIESSSYEVLDPATETKTHMTTVTEAEAEISVTMFPSDCLIDSKLHSLRRSRTATAKKKIRAAMKKMAGVCRN